MIARFILSITFAALFYVNFVVAIWPIPLNYRHGNEVIWIDYHTKWRYYSPPNLDPHINERVTRAIRRSKRQVLKRQLVPWKFHQRGSDFEPSASPLHRWNCTIEKVIIQQIDVDKSRAPKYGEMDESYDLYIPGRKGFESDVIKILEKYSTEAWDFRAVVIVAGHSAGILHALQTLSQLFYAHTHGAIYSPLAPVSIQDRPKFEHRGVNLDVARQWYPKETIFKLIDGLAFNKMNRLHFHVTDSQSWPLEVPALPELSQKGAYCRGLYYSTEDIQEIYGYAEDRGIQVIMEIDMPGHTSAIGYAYPDLVVGQNVQPLWTKFAAQPPSGQLRLNNEKVESFLTKLFDDVLPRLNAYTAYFHTGGDEVNKNIYSLDEGVRSNDAEVIKPYLQRFLNYAHNEVRKHGGTPIVWEEMVVEWDLSLPKDVIVQVWLGDSSIKTATSKGHRVIAGSYQHWYLDCGNGQWLDSHSMAGYPYYDYCSPKKSWRLMYTHDPTSGLSEEESKLVLGGEVHIWSEQIDAHSIDSTVWPRAGAAAEVLWSGRTDEHGNNRTFPDISPRLAEIRERMVNWGISAAPIMQLWCHQNPGDCEFPE